MQIMVRTKDDLFFTDDFVWIYESQIMFMNGFKNAAQTAIILTINLPSLKLI